MTGGSERKCGSGNAHVVRLPDEPIGHATRLHDRAYTKHPQVPVLSMLRCTANMCGANCHNLTPSEPSETFAAQQERSRVRAAPLTVWRIARDVLDRTTFRQSARGLTILRGAPSSILSFRHRVSLGHLDNRCSTT